MSEQQTLSLSFQPELTRRYRSVREAMAAGVYARGLKQVAADLDESAGHLSESLAGGTGDRVRKLDVDTLERYMQVTGDLEPLHYLCSKFLASTDAQHSATLARMQTLSQQMADVLADFGSVSQRPRARRAR